MEWFMIVVFVISVLSLFVAWFLARQILKQDQGNQKMKDVASAIREGANAFLKTQNKTIGILTIVFAVLLFGQTSMRRI